MSKPLETHCILIALPPWFFTPIPFHTAQLCVCDGRNRFGPQNIRYVGIPHEVSISPLHRQQSSPIEDLVGCCLLQDSSAVLPFF
jgi:hypothetical protein